MRPSPSLGPVRAAVLSAAFLMVGLIVVAPSAGAHGDDGKLEAVSVVSSGTSTVVTVRLTYANDAEPVTGATLTLVGDDGAGARFDPLPMAATSTPGEYSATAQMPSAGTWNLRVTSVTPAATLTLTQQISADAGVAPSPSSTETTAVGSSTTPRPTDDGVEPGPAPVTGSKGTSSTDDASDDSGPGAMPWIIGAIALVVVLGLGFFLSKQRGGPPDA